MTYDAVLKDRIVYGLWHGQGSSSGKVAFSHSSEPDICASSSAAASNSDSS